MKLRVLEVLPTLKRAGAERVAVSIARGLDGDRFDRTVVSLFDPFPGGFEPELQAAGVPVWHLGKRRGGDPRMWWRLAKVLRRVRPHIIHTHSYVLRYVWPASWGGRARLVHTVHNLAEREVDRVGRWIHRAVFRAGGAAVAISPEIARSFERVYGAAPAAVIPNGADVERLNCARGAWRDANGFSSGDLLVVSVARLAPQKNPLGLIEAFHDALGDRPHAHLILAGEGELLHACRARAERDGLGARIHFTGMCQDVPALLSASNIFALASDWEGAPLAVIEAMAAGLPILATAVGGVPDLIDDGRTGVLIDPGNLQGFAAALRRLADTPDWRSELGAAAARKAGQFGVAPMVQAYAALFERLVQCDAC